jgi:putative aldouronate transport system substrate-binding protein
MRTISRRDMLKMLGVSTAGAVLAACGTKATTVAPTTPPKEEPTTAPAPTKGKPVTITMIESWFGVPQDKAIIDPVTTAISKKMQDEGLNINVQSMILDDHQNKYPVLYASGADFTMAFDAPWYKMDTLRAQGSLVILDDLFKTYGKKLMDEVTQKILDANKWDGHWYGIPTAGSYGGTCGVVIRSDLLKKYGAAEPDPMKGWPSLEPFLEAVAKNDSTMNPFAVDAAYGPVHDNFLMRRTLGKWGGVDGKIGFIIPDIDKGYNLVDIETLAPYTDTAKLLRTWWEKGYINKTDLPASGPTANPLLDYFMPGKTATVVENEPNYKMVEDQKTLKSSIPDGEVRGFDMAGIQVGRYRPVGALKQWNFIVFNASAPQEQQIAGVQYFDWMTSNQDNIDLWLMGIDGVNYKKEANLRFSEVAGVDSAKNYRRMWYVGGVSGRFMRLPVDLPDEAMAEHLWENDEKAWDFSPYENFNIDTKAVETEMATINAAWAEAYHGLGTGQLPTDEAIAKFKKTLDDAGRQQLKAKIQKQLDDYIAANKV